MWQPAVLAGPTPKPAVFPPSTSYFQSLKVLACKHRAFRGTLADYSDLRYLSDSGCIEMTSNARSVRGPKFRGGFGLGNTKAESATNQPEGS